MLLLFLVCFFRLGFFLLLVVVAVLSVLFGSVGSCLFGVALLLRLRFRCLMLGPCVASSGVDLCVFRGGAVRRLFCRVEVCHGFFSFAFGVSFLSSSC